MTITGSTPTHMPLFVDVEIDDWNCNLICNYTINWNDLKQRQIFAEQANNAIRAKQIVTTLLHKD